MSFWTSIALASFLSASAADGVTTNLALSRGAVESNPVLVNQHVMWGLKAGQGAATVWATAKFEKEHPRATRILLVIGTVGYGALAIHNFHVYQEQRGR